LVSLKFCHERNCRRTIPDGSYHWPISRRTFSCIGPWGQINLLEARPSTFIQGTKDWFVGFITSPQIRLPHERHRISLARVESFPILVIIATHGDCWRSYRTAITRTDVDARSEKVPHFAPNPARLSTRASSPNLCVTLPQCVMPACHSVPHTRDWTKTKGAAHQPDRNTCRSLTRPRHNTDAENKGCSTEARHRRRQSAPTSD